MVNTLYWANLGADNKAFKRENYYSSLAPNVVATSGIIGSDDLLIFNATSTATANLSATDFMIYGISADNWTGILDFSSSNLTMTKFSFNEQTANHSNQGNFKFVDDGSGIQIYIKGNTDFTFNNIVGITGNLHLYCNDGVELNFSKNIYGDIGEIYMGEDGYSGDYEFGYPSPLLMDDLTFENVGQAFVDSFDWQAGNIYVESGIFDIYTSRDCTIIHPELSTTDVMSVLCATGSKVYLRDNTIFRWVCQPNTSKNYLGSQTYFTRTDANKTAIFFNVDVESASGSSPIIRGGDNSVSNWRHYGRLDLSGTLQFQANSWQPQHFLETTPENSGIVIRENSFDPPAMLWKSAGGNGGYNTLRGAFKFDGVQPEKVILRNSSNSRNAQFVINWDFSNLDSDTIIEFLGSNATSNSRPLFTCFDESIPVKRNCILNNASFRIIPPLNMGEVTVKGTCDIVNRPLFPESLMTETLSGFGYSFGYIDSTSLNLEENSILEIRTSDWSATNTGNAIYKIKTNSLILGNNSGLAANNTTVYIDTDYAELNGELVIYKVSNLQWDDTNNDDPLPCFIINKELQTTDPQVVINIDGSCSFGYSNVNISKVHVIQKTPNFNTVSDVGGFEWHGESFDSSKFIFDDDIWLRFKTSKYLDQYEGNTQYSVSLNSANNKVEFYNYKDSLDISLSSEKPLNIINVNGNKGAVSQTISGDLHVTLTGNITASGLYINDGYDFYKLSGYGGGGSGEIVLEIDGNVTINGPINAYYPTYGTPGASAAYASYVVDGSGSKLLPYNVSKGFNRLENFYNTTPDFIGKIDTDLGDPWIYYKVDGIAGDYFCAYNLAQGETFVDPYMRVYSDSAFTTQLAAIDNTLNRYPVYRFPSTKTYWIKITNQSQRNVTGTVLKSDLPNRTFGVAYWSKNENIELKINQGKNLIIKNPLGSDYLNSISNFNFGYGSKITFDSLGETIYLRSGIESNNVNINPVVCTGIKLEDTGYVEPNLDISSLPISSNEPLGSKYNPIIIDEDNPTFSLDFINDCPNENGYIYFICKMPTGSFLYTEPSTGGIFDADTHMLVFSDFNYDTITYNFGDNYIGYHESFDLQDENAPGGVYFVAITHWQNGTDNNTYATATSADVQFAIDNYELDRVYKVNLELRNLEGFVLKSHVYDTYPRVENLELNTNMSLMYDNNETFEINNFDVNDGNALTPYSDNIKTTESFGAWNCNVKNFVIENDALNTTGYGATIKNTNSIKNLNVIRGKDGGGNTNVNFRRFI